MFLGFTAIRCGHCVEKERSRSEINNGRTRDAHWVTFTCAFVERVAPQKQTMTTEKVEDRGFMRQCLRISGALLACRGAFVSSQRSIADLSPVGLGGRSLN